MTAHYDALETREAAAREAELFSRLPGVLRSAMAAPPMPSGSGASTRPR